MIISERITADTRFSGLSQPLLPSQQNLQIQEMVGQPLVKGWILKKIENNASSEPGKPQYKVTLQNENDRNDEVRARIKMAKTINEAIIYHKIFKTNDPIRQYLPQYYGVMDSNGQKIDLDNELAHNTTRELCRKYKKVHLVLKDLVQKTDFAASSVQDFKFAKPSLVANNEEVQLHSQLKHNAFYKLIRRIFFSMSNYSFAFQKTTKTHGFFSWIINLIKRIMNIIRSKNELRLQFKRIDKDQLNEIIRFLKTFKENCLKSDFVFCDASLLFIPFVKNGKYLLKIHLIDLAHGIERQEGVQSFQKMKDDIQASIQDLIQLAEEAAKE